MAPMSARSIRVRVPSEPSEHHPSIITLPTGAAIVSPGHRKCAIPGRESREKGGSSTRGWTTSCFHSLFQSSSLPPRAVHPPAALSSAGCCLRIWINKLLAGARTEERRGATEEDRRGPRPRTRPTDARGRASPRNREPPPVPWPPVLSPRRGLLLLNGSIFGRRGRSISG